jgi:DNA-binding NarL/FixJ family response regulator
MMPAARQLHDSGAGTQRRCLGVLVVDDSAIFRTGMSRAVQAHDGLELVGEADGGRSALTAIADLEPDVVILDLRMPDLDAFEVLHRLHELNPPHSCRVVVISATLEDGVGREILAAGASACLSKAMSRAEICAAALRVAQD